VSLDAESAASSRGSCGQGSLKPAFKREYADPDGLASKGEPFQGQRLRVLGVRSADALQREKQPKSMGWKMRSKIGDRKRWYDLPEEVDRGP
jgi:hypothetical protein